MSASAESQEQGAPPDGVRAPATADFLRMPGNDTCFDCDASCAEDPNPNPNPNLNPNPNRDPDQVR